MVMAEAESSKKQDSPPPLHIVVFPWLAFGHIIPFLELSEQLAKRGHSVTFVSAPMNLARLRPVAPGIRLVPLPLPPVDGLSAGAESTADVPPEKVELLKKAFDGLAAPFAAFLAEACAADGGGDASKEAHCKKPDWIIHDFSHHWLPSIADEHKVQCAVFMIFPAAFVAFVGPKELNDAHPRSTAADFAVPPPWIPPSSSSGIIAFRGHEAAWMAAAWQPNASGVSDFTRFWETTARCPLIVCRCSRELDGPLGCSLLSDLYRKPVLPSGLLAPHDAAAAAAADGEEDRVVRIMRWLDAQPERSVLYVALGSEAPVSADHVRELALGLERSGVRFLWARAVRRPAGGDYSSGGDVLLPEGFEARVAGRGVVREGWVPQVRVLAHAAVGAFLTHCGWGSTVESLFRFGLPLVMLPFIVDQGLIARAMVAHGVGVEVARDDTDGSFSRDDVAAAVRRVMAGEEGEALTCNAMEMQRVVGDTTRQEEYVDELVDYLQRYKLAG